MTERPIAVMWFRNDLRLADNPALLATVKWAKENDGAVLPVFILDDVISHQLGGATKWWLEKSLTALNRDIAGLGDTKSDRALRLFKGNAKTVLETLADDKPVKAVFWNRLYDKPSTKRDTDIKAALQGHGLTCESHKANLLFEPWDVKTGSGTDFKVYSPFWRACQKLPAPREPKSAPESLALFKGEVDGQINITDFDLSPKPVNWAGGLEERFTPGEQGAKDQLFDFIDDRLTDYADLRDRPDRRVTSELSPHLRFGEISPYQVWHAANHYSDANPGKGKTASKFIAELGWREFAHHILYHATDLRSVPLQGQFKHFPWSEDTKGLRAWQKGQTGFPIVDAGMRELWHTGYMHNRVRMIVGSILVKHLLIHWRDGLAWFDDTLVDACPANNPFSWQWIGGCGADAAPYFRIFNPVLQGEKFDPKGDYVRQWVPELRDMPEQYIHKPWEASPLILKAADVTLGKTYPEPLIGLKEGRERALSAYQDMKQAAA
ncbi:MULTISPECIES: deoxyribodipyrimidine photo-lyase [unclassified Thalassospira]|uniref:cryptochrome/photolyase family protein n=1 Tax=unclassified Thalassospira TaxID=2648997 RepID=UPI0007A5B7CA|nr:MULTISPECIES: deoxyribodipyrimidine photo-lyase [unclassified Thalassospira]KZC99358.1 deoxyribodipyrimidine photolyase [Thalassospira sp. MCCC 1A02898]ONH85625.1 deoxyribodipyrimidine photo-lyase [Thalassospira sp. MCCC 1A02803]